MRVPTSVLKKLIVYIRYITESHIPRTAFLTNIEVENGDAPTLFESIRGVLIKHKFSLSRLVGFASDGASVMTGIHNGVAAQLKRICPQLTSIHCVAHRLQLAGLASVHELDYFDHFESTVKLMHSYFSHSTLRMHSLQ